MKLNEPRVSESSRWAKSKNGLLIENKTYIDYLKESEYRESYKQFCIGYYLSHKRDDVTEDKKPPEGD